MDDPFNDPRFGHVMSDPKFKKPPTFKRKVKIDKRFQRMFNDRNFQVKYTVDKRGKPVNQSSVENYGKFYALSDDDDDDDDDDSSEESCSDSSDDSLNKKRNVDKDHGKIKSKGKSDDIGKKCDIAVQELDRTIKKKKKKSTELKKEHEMDVYKPQEKKLEKKKNGIFDERERKAGVGDADADADADDDEEEEEESEGSEEEGDDDDDDDDEEEEEEEEEEESSDDEDDELPNEVKEEALKSVSQNRKLPKEIKDKLRDLSVDYARGRGVLSDSSSSDDSDEDLSAKGEEEEEEAVDLEHDWGELDKDADRTDLATQRLAICNMDWDRIRAVDLMVLCSSFLPAGGLIKSVTIYPSEFGQKRMKEEEIKGPIEIVEQKRLEPEIDFENREEEDEEGNKYHMEQLRKYQLLRLKYFYAIVVCDSADTASTLYSECDGLEYESSATRLDLRFVPDDVTFDEEPRDVCTKLPDINKYQPRLFLNTALQQGKVECTWDETDPERIKLAQKLHQFKGDDTIDDRELKMFLASSEEEDENEEDEPVVKNINNDVDKNDSNSGESDNSDCEDGIKNKSIDKYRNLLAKMQEEEEKKKNRDVEMEITWGVGLKEKAQKMVDKKLKENVPMTPFEKMIEKKKEKKKSKKKERMKHNDGDSTNGNNEDSEDAYSDDDIPEGIDMNDEYFREELEGFAPKKGNKSKKNKHKKASAEDDELDEESTRNANELNLLFMEEKDGENKKKHFNMKKIIENEDESKKKKKKKGRKQLIKNKKNVEAPAPYDDDDFKINVVDERFNALYSSHHFNIDPADSHFRKTKGMEAFIQEKLSRKNNNETNEPSISRNKNIKTVRSSEDRLQASPSKKQKMENGNDLSQMVKSIKRNTQFSKIKRLNMNMREFVCRGANIDYIEGHETQEVCFPNVLVETFNERTHGVKKVNGIWENFFWYYYSFDYYKVNIFLIC